MKLISTVVSIVSHTRGFYVHVLNKPHSHSTEMLLVFVIRVRHSCSTLIQPNDIRIDIKAARSYILTYLTVTFVRISDVYRQI